MTVLILLGLSIFPMLISAYLALSKFSLAPGGYQLRYVGFRNFKKLLFGSQQFHFLGTFGALSWFEWLLLADIPDREIRPDTRAAFAAGQIAALAPILIREDDGLVEEARAGPAEGGP